MHYFRFPFLFLIRLYQKTISPDHGIFSKFILYGVCKFHPTCSEYSFQAIKEHGLARGTILALWRILRCHPFSQGGYDPIPQKRENKKRKFV